MEHGQLSPALEGLREEVRPHFEYDIKTLIGRSNDSVYLAIRRDTGQEIAVKKIRFRTSNSGVTSWTDIIQDFELYAKQFVKLAGLRHPNIVQHLGLELEVSSLVDCGLALTMEYCSGGTLLHKSQSARGLPEAEVKRYARQLIAGLAHIHAQGICHLDVKGTNIFLTENDTIKIGDFGETVLLQSASRTRTDEVKTDIGTLRYNAPEMVNPDHAKRGRAADIYSFGCVLIEMLTGQMPQYKHPTRGYLDDKWKISWFIGTGGGPEIPSTDAISQDMHHLLKQCLDPAPNKRPFAQHLLHDSRLAIVDSNAMVIERIVLRNPGSFIKPSLLPYWVCYNPVEVLTQRAILVRPAVTHMRNPASKPVSAVAQIISNHFSADPAPAKLYGFLEYSSIFTEHRTHVTDDSYNVLVTGTSRIGMLRILDLIYNDNISQSLDCGHVFQCGVNIFPRSRYADLAIAVSPTKLSRGVLQHYSVSGMSKIDTVFMVFPENGLDNVEAEREIHRSLTLLGYYREECQFRFCFVAAHDELMPYDSQVEVLTRIAALLRPVVLRPNTSFTLIYAGPISTNLQKRSFKLRHSIEATWSGLQLFLKLSRERERIVLRVQNGLTGEHSSGFIRRWGSSKKIKSRQEFTVSDLGLNVALEEISPSTVVMEEPLNVPRERDDIELVRQHSPRDDYIPCERGNVDIVRRHSAKDDDFPVSREKVRIEIEVQPPVREAIEEPVRVCCERAVGRKWLPELRYQLPFSLRY